VIEMNPRVSDLRARLEATGYPIAKVARSLPSLHARRDSERSYRHHAGELRATARLRRRQVPALCIREVSRRHTTLGTQMKSVGEADGHRAQPSSRRSARRAAPVSWTEGDLAARRERHPWFAVELAGLDERGWRSVADDFLRINAGGLLRRGHRLEMRRQRGRRPRKPPAGVYVLVPSGRLVRR